MRWRGRRQSGNVGDRRGRGGFRVPRRGMRIPIGTRRGGFGGLGFVLVIVVVSLIFGVNPLSLIEGFDTGGTQFDQAEAPRPPAEDEMAQFVSVVLADTEDTWNQIFANQVDRDYEEPRLILFASAVQSACGVAQSATGPFYCPGDRQIYIDLAFYEELRRRFEAPGDFAQAYVIAHEVGHHVQTLLGISERVRNLQGRTSGAEANRLSVRQELQADCFAGIWAHYVAANETDQVALQSGDVEEALGAASAIGDDRLQRQSQGYVQPETFTHGSSAQRARWFRRGLEGGDMRQCDTFNTDQL